MPEEFETASLQLTPRGVVVLWLSGGLLLAGVVMIDAVLVTLSLVFALAVLVARWWARRNLRQIHVERELPLTAWAGSAVEVPFAIANLRRRMAAFDVEVRADGRVAEGLRLPAGAGASFLARMRVPPRGRHDGGEWRVCSTFPAGLFEARRGGVFGDAWMVYPAPALPRELERLLERAKLEQLMKTRLLHEAGGEFHGIRDYQSGDPMKAIHWPASARTGRLMARQWDPPAPMEGRVGIVVHSVSASRRMFRSGSFELALKAACGLVRYFRNEGVPVSFAAGFDAWNIRRAPDRGRFSALFEVLAVARRRTESSAQGLTDVLAQLAGSGGHHRSDACDRIFVIGDAPLDDWKALVDGTGQGSGGRSETELICISGETVNVRQPRLRMRELVREKLATEGGQA